MSTLVIEYLPEDYGGIRPKFGENTCFFETHIGNLLFFHILLMALEVANIILFVAVAAKLHRNWKLSKKLGIRQSSIKNGTKSSTFKGAAKITQEFLSFLVFFYFYYKEFLFCLEITFFNNILNFVFHML